MIRSAFLPFEADAILKIPLSHSLPDDKLIWMGNNRGEFTVKSAYHLAHCLVESKEEAESSNGDPFKPLWKNLWASNFLLRLRYLYGGLVSMGCLLGTRFALVASLLTLNVLFVERFQKMFIMLCFTTILLIGFGIAGLICCI